MSIIILTNSNFLLYSSCLWEQKNHTYFHLKNDVVYVYIGYFWEILVLLTNCYIHIKTRRKIFDVWVWSVLMYGSEHWVLQKKYEVCLERSNWAKVNLWCEVFWQIKKWLRKLRISLQLRIAPLTLLRVKHLRLFGHVIHSVKAVLTSASIYM